MARNLLNFESMRNILLFCLLVLTFSANAQKVMPFVDFNNYFRSFQLGFFRQVEFQQIRDFKAGVDLVAYVDNRGNLRVYDGVKPVDLTNIVPEYTVSDHLLTWKIGPTLNMWDNGFKKTLTYFANQYVVRDSLIVYQDTQLNSVKVYYNGEDYTLYSSIGDLSMPDYVGENIIAFRDNGNFYKVFWRGNIYELDVWHNPIQFHGGTDMLVFNDPMNGTFTIFENGEFLDVEDFHMNQYKAGRELMVYENLNNDLLLYANGEKTQLTNFGAEFWDVVDDVVIWGENGFTYAYQNGKKIEIARYIPADYKLKNNVICFRNIMGGVDVLIDGKVKNLTNQQNANYTIYGNSVLVELFNRSFIVHQNGKEYRN